jgi:hypothetical protein
MNGGTVNTNGYESYGLWIDQETTSTATAKVTSGTITTQGLRAHGVLVESNAGDTSVTLACTISTNGESTEGISTAVMASPLLPPNQALASRKMSFIISALFVCGKLVFDAAVH